ncbi:hypothetical protein G6F57_002943 [Rhizopus arrhizus]|uniref:Uncharacterized protein n=1 Tax=Rhizopus oryzae TaxID=64495 RepID=A0A9P6XH13_RHIOR|nr:hypothetical protein G6F24_002457 [Rhizopus arrhizus]KAG1426472.1 hypothetical protein G6F58_001464 [Rhizopus delemar]KAG0794398.1 hypothetical protein G6F21_002888 [Rhizopus arrhizus]KAG0802026.1 hypothetical protein G6F22_000667 [Rhizopus arrhizus]KAG0815578.1 hypothetical protein G6F20_003884 [Rhizopus arrhizus]
MVGSKSFNILITASTTISTLPIHSVRQSTNITLSVIASEIYLRSTSVKKFKETFNPLTSSSTITNNNIYRLRQVTSSSQDKSTYYMLRSTLEPFDDDLYRSVTTFSLCGLPNNEGYGCSNKSYMKLMSKLLRITATKVITKNTKFEMTDFDEFIKFEFISSQKKKPETKDDTNTSKILKSLMEASQSCKEKNGEQADVVEFARSYSISSLAITANSAVSKGNEKITESISMLLSRLFS